MSLSPRDLQIESTEVATTLPITFRHNPRVKPRALALFLHGYCDHSGSFLRRLYPNGFPESFHDVTVLAPNGPFPVPVKTDVGWLEAYAWYFYDDKEQKMIISPESAVLACQLLIEKFGYQDLPKVIVAFSQGGYLAPYLAARIKNVKEIIAIGTGFREDYYPEGSGWRLTAIHGSDDSIFPVADARKAHARILAKGFEGAFFEIPKLAHVASEDVGAIVETRLNTFLQTY